MSALCWLSRLISIMKSTATPLPKELMTREIVHRSRRLPLPGMSRSKSWRSTLPNQRVRGLDETFVDLGELHNRPSCEIDHEPSKRSVWKITAYGRRHSPINRSAGCTCVRNVLAWNERCNVRKQLSVDWAHYGQQSQVREYWFLGSAPEVSKVPHEPQWYQTANKLRCRTSVGQEICEGCCQQA